SPPPPRSPHAPPPPRAAPTPLSRPAAPPPHDTTALTGEYWYRNLRRPVEFAAAVGTALDDGFTAFLEMSPHPLLTHGVLETAESAGLPAVAVGTLRRGEGGVRRFLLSAAEAFVHGVPVEWRTSVPGPGRAAGHVDLPTYPFQRERHWLTSAGHGGSAPRPPAHPEATAAPAPAPTGEAAVLDLVRSLAADVLGYRNGAGPAADETFLSAGMTSLPATQLRTRLSHHLGVELASTAVFDHATPAALSRHLSRLLERRTPGADEELQDDELQDGELPDGLEALYWQALTTGRADVALRLIGDASLLRPAFGAASHAAHVPAAVRLAHGDTAPALVCLPSVVPAAGPHEYAALARLLPDRRSVWALPQPGFGPGEALPADGEALLAVHTAAVASLGPDSPYVLCGHSSGGLVARALAARLEQLGRPAVGLVLLDTFEEDDLFHTALMPGLLTAAAARQDVLGPTGAGTTRLTATGAYLRLLGDLPAGPASTPTLLVRAALPLPGAPEGVPEPRRHAAHTTAVVDGDHFTMMDAPRAASVATVLGDWLAAR
ncbi:alpha/beta fold hydrolase, partial [Streptomyces sp. NPDC127110]|uniref:alpha/beta fold hydrolase n=1 Tax=Streptomyces sp. NPDC127110 TaxID=3345362 RepID=UPI0036407A71